MVERKEKEKLQRQLETQHKIHALKLQLLQNKN
jgi:hypothetical protein